MRFPKSCCVVLCLSLGSAVCGCRDESKPVAVENQELNHYVVATSYPLMFLGQRIAGDKLAVEFPAARTERPAEWQPTTDDIKEIQSADLIITNGPDARYARWLDQITVPEKKFCQSTRDIARTDLVRDGTSVVHSHGPGGMQAGDQFVAFTWLSPKILVKQATTICQCMSQTYPEFHAEFELNLQRLEGELRTVMEPLDSPFDCPAIVAPSELAYFIKSLAATTEVTYLDSKSQAEFVRKLNDHLQEIEDDEQQVVLTAWSSPANDLNSHENVRVIPIDLLELPVENSDFLVRLRKNFSKVTRSANRN